MPKRMSILLAVLALLLAACSTAQPYFGSPTPAPSGTATANPNITQTTVTALYQKVAQAGVTVCESAGTGGCYSHGATPIATVVTNNLGQAVFTGLTPGVTYCWEAMVNGVLLNNCTSNWDPGVQIGQ